MLPNGTKPISTAWSLIFSHRSEPRAMPTEKTASSNVTTWALACKTSLANGANWVRNTAPKNHNQEIPSIDRKTLRVWRAMPRFRQVSEKGLGLMVSVGSLAGVAGIFQASTMPSTDKPNSVAVSPVSDPLSTSKPHAMVPARIATKVPISTRPLPATMSWGSRCCGK